MCSSDLDYMRIRGFPFNGGVEEFIMRHNYCFVVEQNRDAQLRSLLLLETPVPKDRLRSVLNYGGFPLSARHVVEPIIEQVPPELLRGGTKTQDSRRTVVSDTWE